MTRRRQDGGTYSSIPRALRDGADFQQLSPIARHCLYDLKMAFGPSGIEVRYYDALVGEMACTTGWERAQVVSALGELEVGSWLRREANVVWIVAQLRSHPHMRPDNGNHVVAVRNHVAGLPRLAIVRAFIEHYADYFSDAATRSSDYPGEPPAIDDSSDRDRDGDNHAPSHAHNHAGNHSDGYGDQQLEVAVEGAVATTNTSAAASAAGVRDGRSRDATLIGFARCWAIYPRRKGPNSRAVAEKAYLARVNAGVSEAVLYEKTRDYRDWTDGTGKTGTEIVMMASTFYGPNGRYDEDWRSFLGSSADDGSPVHVIPGARDAKDAKNLRAAGF